MVYGTDNGVYLSDLREHNKVPIKVISVPNVTQLDVLEEQGILIVLAGSPPLSALLVRPR
jgi:RHO1 GDP-GTP exchange protein 1/2